MLTIIDPDLEYKMVEQFHFDQLKRKAPEQLVSAIVVRMIQHHWTVMSVGHGKQSLHLKSFPMNLNGRAEKIVVYRRTNR